MITQSGSQKTKYKLIKLPTTLSRKLVDDYLVRGLAHMMSRDQDSRYERDRISLPDAPFDHLASDDIPATPQERKLRRFVAALACWWDARPNECQRQLEKLALKNPKDIELQIETARLEIENNRSRDAFQRIDRIRPADARESLYVETARLKLASQIGDTGQINVSTSKIKTPNIDRETRQLLDQSAVLLSTTNTLLRSSPAKTNQPSLRIRQDDKERLRFAKVPLELGDGITASSIAYSVIENRERLRSSDLTDYRQQAIGVIAKAGRLQQLIATTAEQFKESKKSEQLREELAELYVLCGRLPDAQRLWEESAVSNGMSPEQMVDQANTLAGKRRNHQAAMMSLYAFERKPELWNKHWAVFTQAGELSGAKSAIYERLSRMDIRSFSLFSLCNVIQMNPADRFSDSQRQFVAHVIRTHPDTTKKGRLLSRFLPQSERESFPEWNPHL